MTVAHYLLGDTRKVMSQLPDGCVDLVLTSPPFLALRSYLPADDPKKPLEIGSEATPGEFLDVLLDCTDEWARLLTQHGTLAVELGDTYAGSGGAGGDYGPVGLREGQPEFDGSAARTRSNRPGQYGTTTGPPRRVMTDAWPLDKSLTLVPEMYRLALAYGRNPLTGREVERWRVRNLVRWVRPNPPVGALGDKFRPATSDLVVACKAGDRWFDLDAVRTPHKADPSTYTGNGYTKGNPAGSDADRAMPGNPAGAPPLDWWKISPGGYTGSHYAVWPPELLERPIEAMCPRRVCRTCGTPSRRETSTEQRDTGRTTNGPKNIGRSAETVALATRTEVKVTTTGWTTCGCPGSDGIRLDGYHTGTGWRPGRVLDPFGGTGTTGLVATGRGRDAVLIDLDDRNLDLARERLGMFLNPTTPAALVAEWTGARGESGAA